MPDQPAATPNGDRHLEVLRLRLGRKLSGFTAEIPEENARTPMASYKPVRALFPVPELVLFALREGLGWQWHGHGEKVRWTVYGAIDGQRVAFEHQKFGFTVFLPKERLDLRSRVEGQLRGALRLVEAYLRPFAKAQVDQGEVMIVNRFIEFDERYRFHRELADVAYRRAAEPQPPKASGDESHDERTRARLISLDMTERINAILSAEREGFFHSTAMIDAYFSCLEHRLVLLRAFMGRPFAQGEVLGLLGMKWADKLKLVLPTPLPADAAQVVARMRRIKERIRNPFAHGGVENDQGSLFFRLPGIGSVPGNFTRFGDSVRFSMLPVDADDHAESCATFDALDALLAAGDLVGPDQFIKGTVDPVFDAQHCAQYAKVIAGGLDDIEAYIDVWSHRWERHANMDY
ncbi:hypothetical protein [Sphingobium sp.]|uniref:hypothetical protein n=1 Tax=Sphingobium sp. TaxID=1912891 RepID=UPI0025DF2AA8|nr:hypothetical protein [Sphingobium sp.]